MVSDVSPTALFQSSWQFFSGKNLGVVDVCAWEVLKVGLGCPKISITAVLQLITWKYISISLHTDRQMIMVSGRCQFLSPAGMELSVTAPCLLWFSDSGW